MSKRYYKIEVSVETEDTFEQFEDKFMDYVENNNYTIGGGLGETDEDGNYIKLPD